jgi:hypothetical protein
MERSMMGRLGTASLAVLVNLLCTTASTIVVAAESSAEDDRRITRPASHGPVYAPPALLATASGLFGEQIDTAWAVVSRDGPAVAVAVQHGAAHVARLEIAVEQGKVTSRFWEDAVTRALAFCRDHDVLKVLVTTTGVPAAHVRALAASRGFQLSRAGCVDGLDVAEFYTDLYWSAHDAARFIEV